MQNLTTCWLEIEWIDFLPTKLVNKSQTSIETEKSRHQTNSFWASVQFDIISWSNVIVKRGVRSACHATWAKEIYWKIFPNKKIMIFGNFKNEGKTKENSKTAFFFLGNVVKYSFRFVYEFLHKFE